MALIPVQPSPASFSMEGLYCPVTRYSISQVSTTVALLFFDDCALLFRTLVWIFCIWMCYDVFSFMLKRPQFRLAKMHLAALCMNKPSKAPLF